MFSTLLNSILGSQPKIPEPKIPEIIHANITTIDYYVDYGDDKILLLSPEDRLRIAEESYLFQRDQSLLAKTSPDINKFIQKSYPKQIKFTPERKLQTYTNHLRYKAITSNLKQYGFYCYVFNLLVYCAENPNKNLSKTIEQTLKPYLIEYFKLNIASDVDLHHTDPSFPVLKIIKIGGEEVLESGKIKYDEIDKDSIDQQLSDIISDLQILAKKYLNKIDTIKTLPPTPKTPTIQQGNAPTASPNTLEPTTTTQEVTDELIIENLDIIIEERRNRIAGIKARRRDIEKRFQQIKFNPELSAQKSSETHDRQELLETHELKNPGQNLLYDLNQEINQLRTFINKLNIPSLRNKVVEKLNDIQTINRRLPDGELGKIGWQQDIAQIVITIHRDLQKYHSVVTHKNPTDFQEHSFQKPTMSSLIRTELTKTEISVQNSLRTIDNHLKRAFPNKIIDLDKVPPNLLKALSAQRCARLTQEDLIRT